MVVVPAESSKNRDFSDFTARLNDNLSRKSAVDMVSMRIVETNDRSRSLKDEKVQFQREWLSTLYPPLTMEGFYHIFPV